MPRDSLDEAEVVAVDVDVVRDSGDEAEAISVAVETSEVEAGVVVVVVDAVAAMALLRQPPRRRNRRFTFLELCGSGLLDVLSPLPFLCWSGMDHERNEFSFAESLRKQPPHLHLSFCFERAYSQTFSISCILSTYSSSLRGGAISEIPMGQPRMQVDSPEGADCLLSPPA